MRNIKVKDIMTPEVVMIAPTASVLEAARKMKEADCGFLPVGHGKDIRGILTDRDIVIRALANGNDPATETVASLMTPHVYCCNENDFVEDAVSVMYSHSVMRLLVKNHAGALVGVLSLSGVLRHDIDPHEIIHAFKSAYYPGATWRI